MLSRRKFAALAAAIPFMQIPRLDIRDTKIEPLDVGRTAILSISPDASILMGVRVRNRLVFLDATSLEEIALGEQMDELAVIDPASISWSPDGSRLAFSLVAWRTMTDSDIFIAEAATATITNATAEGHDDEAASLLDAEDVRIDLFPQWLDDSTLIFARHENLEADNFTCELCTLDTESHAVTAWASLDTAGYRFVNSPLHVRTDGSVVAMLQAGSEPGEIAIVSAEGDVSPVTIEGVAAPMLVDANDTHAIVLDRQAFGYWLVPLDDPATATPMQDLFQTEVVYTIVGEPCLGPGPDAIAAVVDTGEKIRVFTWVDGEQRDRAHLQRGNPTARCTWHGDAVLMTSRENAWLLPIK